MVFIICKAFSCIISKSRKVTWKLGVDSHDDLVKLAGYKDDTADKNLLKFARVEITPDNGDYLYPDKWTLRIDEKITPVWWSDEHERKCLLALQKWIKELNKILVRKPVIHPFRDVQMPDHVDPIFLKPLVDWASVWASVRASVGDSVRDSVWAYTGSFFVLPREGWKYCESILGEGYPFQPLVNLWEIGIVPSFDGKIWRLHAGPQAAIIWKGTIEDAKKQLEASAEAMAK